MFYFVLAEISLFFVVELARFKFTPTTLRVKREKKVKIHKLKCNIL